MLTLEQLTTPVSEDDAMATILAVLTQLGFQATSWQSGAIQLTVLRLFAKTYSGLTTLVSDIAAGGFAALASTGWLTLLAKYVYGLDRIAAQSTVGQVVLTSSAAAPVHTWITGDIIVADQPQGTDNANTYTVTVPGTLAPGTSAAFEFKADVPGAAGNIAPGTTLYLWTPLVGVTPTNPVLAPPNNSTWITTPGADEESNQRLAARCLARWSRLTYSNVDGAYVGWALEALPAITRITIGSAAGDGNVKIYAATALGPITGPQATTVANYVNGIADGIGRRPINDIVSVLAPSVLTTPPIVIDAYVESAQVPTAAAAITNALNTYIGSLPIGGTRLQFSQGRVIYSELVALSQDQTGIRSVALSISSDVLLNPDQIYQPTITVNVHPVAPGT